VGQNGQGQRKKLDASYNSYQKGYYPDKCPHPKKTKGSVEKDNNNWRQGNKGHWLLTSMLLARQPFLTYATSWKFLKEGPLFGIAGIEREQGPLRHNASDTWLIEARLNPQAEMLWKDVPMALSIGWHLCPKHQGYLCTNMNECNHSTARKLLVTAASKCHFLDS